MNEDDICPLHYVKQEAVQAVTSQMLSEELFQEISEDFKVLSDPTRLKILYALSKKELCVCDLASLLNMSHSSISHQLRLMRSRNLVKFRKNGKNVFYSLKDQHISVLLKMEVEHAQE